MKLRWIGQNGYLLSDGKTEICIDPYLSDVVNRIASRPRMVPAPVAPEELASDLVICTHDHLDHVDIDAIPLMKKETMRFLAPTHAHPKLVSCGVEVPIAFDEGDRYEIGDFSLEAVFADHSVPAVGVIVRHCGVTLYFSGDTEYHEKLHALKDKEIDVMFICINGRLGNMNVDQAVQLTEIISPRVGVPTHYGMFESNTEDPAKYTSRIPHSFEMLFDREYTVDELLERA